MGRTPKPTALQQQSGAFAHDPQRARARADEPIPTAPLGGPPAHLTHGEALLWHELAGMMPDGVWTIADRWSVEVLCRYMGRFRRGQYLTAADINMMISLMARLGLTPADRTRIKAPQAKKNKFAKFNVQ